jgi:hypothetical protein
VARTISLNPATIEAPGTRYVHYRLVANGVSAFVYDRRGGLVRMLEDATVERTGPTTATASGTNPQTGEAETWTAVKSAGCGCRARNQRQVPTP